MNTEETMLFVVAAILPVALVVHYILETMLLRRMLDAEVDLMKAKISFKEGEITIQEFLRLSDQIGKRWCILQKGWGEDERKAHHAVIMESAMYWVLRKSPGGCITDVPPVCGAKIKNPPAFQP